MRRLTVLLLWWVGCTIATSAQVKQTMEVLRTETTENLKESLLPFWMKHVVDPAGGFYGVVMNDGKAIEKAPKGAVLNARILWTFSRAYRQYGLEAYKQMADRAADYYIRYFIDPTYGGVFWQLDCEGYPKDPTKQTYACAFGIYGLAEHFRATGDHRSLEAALKLYNTLEEKVHDKAGLGYIESFQRDYTKAPLRGVDGQANASKTMNTHIHVLEAYTTLYQAWPDEGLRDNLRELLGILQTKLYSPRTNHLILYCDDNWNPIGEIDSYGHDIETSWLMSEAAAVVGDPVLKKQVDEQAVKMARTALKEGLNAEGAMLYEKSPEGMVKRLSWWPQCETIIGCVNAWQLSGDPSFLEAALRNWTYVKAHFIDHQHGGWFKDLAEDGQPLNYPKVSDWNCPYHNSRLAFELAERLAPATVHTEVMAWSNMTGVRLEGELIDFESSLRVGTIGGEMEKSGREKQQRIRYRREDNTQQTITPMHGAEFIQTVTDLDQQTVSLHWQAEAKDDLNESAWFCMTFPVNHYAKAKIGIQQRKVTITAPERKITLTFDRPVTATVREEEGDKVLYVTLLPTLKKDCTAELAATMTVDGTRHHETAEIALDLTKPGRTFAGFGGNFRIQNPAKDPTVIDYCLRNMRVAFGRVEMPWAVWDTQGADAPHVKHSAEMARRLKQIGMPVIVSCWFPPLWAGDQTTRSDGTARAFHLKASEQQRIFASLASYLEFLKKNYGVEADYFSFNESDLGIDVVFSPEEHRDFIKAFGQYLADKGLKTLMLLGDNSDATTFDFIQPTLSDPSAHKYVGAISFHSWRGCDDATLEKWAGASRQINVPLIVGEGSTDAAAHQYPAIFKESTFALYEINLYTRLCAICQPWSILQWQLTSDYSLLWGDGIYQSEGPLRPTQRFFNLKQLAMTPENAFAVPVTCNKEHINAAAFTKTATGEWAVHLVNNGASCEAVVTGFPAGTQEVTVYVTNSHSRAEARQLKIKDSRLTVQLPAESFITMISKYKTPLIMILSILSLLFISLSINKESGIYEKGERAVVTCHTDAVPTDSLFVSVSYNNKVGREFRILPKATDFTVSELAIDSTCAVSIEVKNGSGEAASIGYVVAPEGFRAGYEEPADLMDYWSNLKQQLKALPMQVKTTQLTVPQQYQDKYTCEDVEINCLGPAPMRGYVAKPVGAKEKSLPIIILCRAAGVKGDWCRCSVNECVGNAALGNGALSFDLNAHGMLNGQSDDYYQMLEDGLLNKYWEYNAADRETYYFRGMYLRVLRAIEYMTSLPEWDGRRLLVIGESQGGGQAVAAAGLDPRVSAVVLNVPAMQDLGGARQGRLSGWPQPIENHQDLSPAQLDNTLPYFDGSQLIRHSQAEIFCEIGLIDTTCPPSAVFSSLNNAPGKKTVNCVPYRTHAWPSGDLRPHWEEKYLHPREAFINDYLK